MIRAGRHSLTTAGICTVIPLRLRSRLPMCEERSDAEGRVARPVQGEGRDGRRADRAFRPLIEQADKEPGTLLYVLHRSKDDPDSFWVSELYADNEPFAAHG